VRRRWLITAMFAVAAIVVAVVVSRLLVHHVRGDSYLSAGSVLVSADGLTLSATTNGGCREYVLEAVETETTVTVRVLRSQGMMFAPGVCAVRSFPVQLHAPLGNRQLIDGVTHRALPSFDGKSILRPSHLPDGFVHAYDTASFGDETVVGSQAGCVQLYIKGDEYDDAILISQDVGAVWRAPDGVTVQPLTIRGQSGGAVPGEIEWIEKGQLFTIRSMTYAYATLSNQQLLDIAESLG
jgi:hypothetical protein